MFTCRIFPKTELTRFILNMCIATSLENIKCLKLAGDPNGNEETILQLKKKYFSIQSSQSDNSNKEFTTK